MFNNLNYIIRIYKYCVFYDFVVNILFEYQCRRGNYEKSIFFAVIFVVITVLLNIFMQPIVDSIGIATMYIAILIFYALYALIFIIIADTAKWITKGGIGGIYRRRKKM
ncbi:hypothetical protein MC28_G383 (plasmid) [Bacillus thuringiensis MC28]|nr:hypothetical protein MC28_G383 [Bacillus thuringiensis MC28]